MHLFKPARVLWVRWWLSWEVSKANFYFVASFDLVFAFTITSFICKLFLVSNIISTPTNYCHQWLLCWERYPQTIAHLVRITTAWIDRCARGGPYLISPKANLLSCYLISCFESVVIQVAKLTRAYLLTGCLENRLNHFVNQMNWVSTTYAYSCDPLLVIGISVVQAQTTVMNRMHI